MKKPFRGSWRLCWACRGNTFAIRFPDRHRCVHDPNWVKNERDGIPMKRPDEAKLAGEQSQPDGVSLARPMYDTLWEYMTSKEWDDGKPRESSTLLLFFEDGLFKVCLTDRALKQTAWASARTPEDALVKLNDGIREGEIDWRKQRPMTKK